jgi:crossover junction endodeoxyribonuclease RuvC
MGRHASILSLGVRMSVAVLGADPGITGAIAALDHCGAVVTILDLPVREIPGISAEARYRFEIDPRALCQMLKEIVPPSDRGITFAIEQTSAVARMGQVTSSDLSSQAALAASRASIVAVAELMGFRVVRVRPQVWKKPYGKLKDKEEARQMALSLYPACKEISRKKDHNRSDALLLARYAHGELL